MRRGAINIMKRWLVLGVAGGLALAGARADEYPDPGAYDWSGVAVGAKVGTLGFGPEVAVHVAPWLNLRGSFNLLDWDMSREIEDVDYDATFDYTSFLAVVDIFPYSGRSFHLSGGVALVDGLIDLKGTPENLVRIGNNDYEPDEVGTITSVFSAENIAPYAGIGFGNPVRPDQAWSFTFDLGVIFQSADVSISSNGSKAGDPQFEADLELERQEIESDLDAFKVYPVVSFTIAYHF